MTKKRVNLAFLSEVGTKRVRPGPTGHPVRELLQDRRNAKKVGEALGAGIDFVADGESLPSEQLIDEEAAQLVAAAAHRLDKPRSECERIAADAKQRKAHAEAAVKAEENTRQKAVKELSRLNERQRGPSRKAYAITQLLLGVTSLPVDLTVAETLPLPTTGRWVIALSLGGVLCWIAHLAAHKLHGVVEHWDRRNKEPARFLVDAVQLALALTVPIAAILTFGALRTSGLTVIARLTGDVFAELDPSRINKALVTLQILLFIGAVIVGYRHAEGARRHSLEKELRESECRLRTHQATADMCDRVRVQAEQKLMQIDRRLIVHAEAVDARRRRRHHRHRHIVAKARTQTQLKAAGRRTTTLGHDAGSGPTRTNS